MPYAIRCYEGQDDWVSRKWLAHMNLGNDVYMSFFGPTKKEAEEKARAWYEKEKARFEKIYVPDKPKTAPVQVMGEQGNAGWGSGWNDSSNTIDAMGAWPNPNAVGVNDGIVTATNRGHHFAGKVWMVKQIDGLTKHKTRVDQSQVAEYEAQGYKKGGPRS